MVQSKQLVGHLGMDDLVKWLRVLSCYRQGLRFKPSQPRCFAALEEQHANNIIDACIDDSCLHALMMTIAYCSHPCTF